MDKGIRPAAIAKFAELLPTRATVGNARFRAEVRFFLIENFGITGAAASTHYNHAFQEAKKVPELAGLLAGLGRPEGKNSGGRKKKVVPEAATLISEGVKENTSTLTVTVNPAADDANDAGETAAEQTLFTVKKKSDGTVVGTFSFEDATALVAKAKAAKKAALYMV